MSVINQALNQAAEKQSGSRLKLEAAAIPPVKRSAKRAWALGGAALSLCLGGWVLTGQALTSQLGQGEPVDSPDKLLQVDTAPVPQQPPAEASADMFSNNSVSQQVEVVPDEPTKVLSEPPADDIKPQIVTALAQEPKPDTQDQKPEQVLTASEPARPAAKQPEASTPLPAKVKPVQPAPRQSEAQQLARKSVSTETDSVTPISSPAVKPVAQSAEPQQVAAQLKAPQTTSGQLQVQQVELSPDQVAQRAVERARRALDGNDLTTAIKEYETALKYRPVDNQSRKRLAALYYGRQDVRNAVEILRKGIRIQEDNQALRIALSRILARQQQPEAALSPLRYLPLQPEVDYLALRAALAQQVKQTEIALESYQLLVEREGDNARWWLGLGIQHERLQQYNQARQAYKQALGRVGVSHKTQAFIRDRLDLIARLQGEQSAD